MHIGTLTFFSRLDNETSSQLTSREIVSMNNIDEFFFLQTFR